MKICVISDTHARSISELSPSLIDTLTNVDLIIHLGDYETKELVDDFKKLNNFIGITGNHDFGEIRSILPKTEILEINGKRLGLIHGHGCTWPFGLRRGLSAHFKKEKIEAILFGHTHIAKNRVDNDILYFNPGSAVARFPAIQSSYGIVNIGESITGEILTFMPSSNTSKLRQAYSIMSQYGPRRVIYSAATFR